MNTTAFLTTQAVMDSASGSSYVVRSMSIGELFLGTSIAIFLCLFVSYYFVILIRLIMDDYHSDLEEFIKDMVPFRLWIAVLIEKIKDMKG